MSGVLNAIRVGSNDNVDSFVLNNPSSINILFTEDGKQIFVNKNGTKMQISDFEVVENLPSSPFNKIYILNSSGNYTMHIYDGSAWHLLSVESADTQIKIQSNAPTDTTKLWLDITSMPILKYHNGTSWINISGSSTEEETTSTIKTKLGSASSTNDGYLTSTDWNTFNNKANSTHNHIISEVTGLQTNLDKKLEPSNIKAGDNITVMVSGNDVTINSTATSSGGDSSSINGITVDDSTRSNGRVLTYNNAENTLEYADINITGVIGSSQLTNAGQNVIIPSGNEITFSHPASTNIIPVIEEQIAGSSATDTHVDFSDANKYILQDNEKISVGNNKVQLDIGTKLLMHMDTSGFTDEIGHTVTNNSVVFNSTVKKFGNGSAYFNGTNSSLDLPISNDFLFGTSSYTIDFWINPTSIKSDQYIMDLKGLGNSLAIEYYNSQLFYKINTVPLIAIPYSLSTNTWYHIAVTRNVDTVNLFVNGTIIGSVTSTSSHGSSTNAITIGQYGINNDYGFNGYIDEFRISKGIAKWTSNFTPPTYSYSIYSANTPLYLQTTGTSNYSLTTIDTITSLTIPCTIPTNTTVKCLFSVDNKVNWLYYNGVSIQKFTETLTSDWGSTSSSVSQMQTYFTNKTIANLTSDLNSLGIVPINLDFCFQLNSQTTVDTPSISPITLIYITKPHTEFSSLGSYSETNVKFGIKRISNSQLAVKNLTSSDRTIKLNIVTSN